MDNQQTQLLKDYTDREKGAYLGAIASIASADSEASAEEMEFLEALAESAGLSEESRKDVLAIAKDPRNINVQKCLDALKQSDLRFSLVTDLMGFANADGDVSPEEEAKIKAMSDYLNINQEQYSVLKEFVHTADKAQQQGEDVLEPGFMEKHGFGQMFNKANIPKSSMLNGALGMLAPMVIAGLMSRGRSRGGMMGGGLLGSVLGGMMGGGMMNRNRSRMGGGIGSLISVLGGIGGRKRQQTRGGLDSILGSVLGGGSKRGGW